MNTLSCNKINKLYLLLLIVATSTFNSALSYADSPTFTYVEFEYIANGDFAITDGGLEIDLGLDGFALNASAELGIFLLQASRFELESDTILNSNIEDSISTIALGLTFELPKTSVYGLIRGRRDELTISGGFFDEDETANSIGFEVGARVNLTDRLEINANIGKPALDEGTSLGIGAQFFITKNIGVTIDFSSIEIEDDDLEAEFDTTSIGLRYNF